MSDSVIEVHELTKRFPPPGRIPLLSALLSRRQGTLAVDHVTFSVRRGEIFGLVGPNGAGKTTLVKMLTTLTLPTSGAARVNGYDLSQEDAIKATVGLMTNNERSFFNRLTCRENLHFYAGLHNLTPAQAEARIAELRPMLGLESFLEKRYDLCSTGMKHRLALARAMLNEATLLFLDEPTSTLDPLAAAQFRETLFALARQGRYTIFIVTHDLDEAVELCDRAALMLRGQLRVVESPEALRAAIKAQERLRVTVENYAPAILECVRAVESARAAAEPEIFGGKACVEVQLQERKRDLPAVVRAIEESGGNVAGLEFAPLSWDAVYADVAPAAPAATLPQSAAAPPTAAPGPSRPPASPFGAILAGVARKAWLFLRRDLKLQLSYRLSFFLQFFGIFFSIASFYFVAQVFGLSASPYLQNYGGSYFPFVLIGIAFSGYQSVALYSFVNVIETAQTMGTLEAMLVTPTRLPTILFASSLWNFVFTSFRVFLYLLVGMLLFGVSLAGANVGAGVLVLLLTIVSLSAVGIFSASFTIAVKQGNPINFFIASVSTLLGGVYYPVEVLPDWMQTLAKFYPLTYSLQAMRRALLMGEPLRALLPELAALVGFSVLLLPLSLVAFRYAVRYARREGSLTQF